MMDKLSNETLKMLAKVEGARRKAKDRGPVVIELPTPEIPAAPKVIQFPLPWAEPVRGVPNSVLRSALFGAIKKGRRAFQQRVQKASLEGVIVIHTGPTLDQADLDVWEQCLHLAKNGGLGTRIQYTVKGFLKSIERATGKSQREWLKGALARLTSSVVEIKDGKRVYMGPLIHHIAMDDDGAETERHAIELNPAIVALYGTDGWSSIEWEQRQLLRRQPLAQWLHGFYTTHAKPYPYKVETLHRLCGSEAKLMKHFRPELREALDKLAMATGWGCEIDDSDLVHVEKKPTNSQARHIVRKLTGQKKNGTLA